VKKSEKVLLIGTIGFGLVLVASSLPGKGGQSAPVADGGAQGVSAGPKAKQAPALTLELLATKRVELTPLPNDLRNPFRLVQEDPRAEQTRLGVQVTAIFGEEGQLAALVKTKVLEAEKAAGDLTVVRVTAEDGARAALGKSTVVRAGDTIGSLQVVSVKRGGVVLEYRGKRFIGKLHTRNNTSQ